MSTMDITGGVEVLWQGEDVAILSQWFFDDGDMVSEGDVICELMQEKTVLEVDAPVSGRLVIAFRDVEAEIQPGTVLARIAEDTTGTGT